MEIHCLEFVYTKNYFNLAKIFLLRVFKMVANQSAQGLKKKKSVMKYLVAEKWSLQENCDVYGEASFI